MTHDEMVEVILAHKAGKKIQFKHRIYNAPDWDGVHDPAWDFASCDYRIAPEDSVLLFKANKYGTVVVPVSTPSNLKLTFDGETGELKSAEVLK